MRLRGACYWKWADAGLHCQTHAEQLSNSSMIDVQARLSRVGATQMFIGVYSSTGVVLIEMSYDNRPGESMMRALAWGVQHARGLAEGLGQLPERNHGI